MAADTDRTTTADVPAGGEPAPQAIRVGVVAEPGIHQPAQAPSATWTWRRPRMTEARSTWTVVGVATVQPFAAVMVPAVSNA